MNRQTGVDGEAGVDESKLALTPCCSEPALSQINSGAHRLAQK
jgi:hypothetical protein